MASCGPTNALSSLLKHTQRDNSLQHEYRNQPQQHVQPGFKQGGIVDNRLNNEFANFNNNDFALSFMGNSPMFQQNQHFQNQQPQSQHLNSQQFHNQQFHKQLFNDQALLNQHQQSNQRQLWVNDFSAMSLQGQASHMQTMNQPQMNAQQNFQSYRPMMGMLQMSGYNPQMNMVNQVPPTEHKEVHKLEEENKLYEDQFSTLEKQLQNETQEVEQMVDDSREKEEFARMAEKVKGSLMTSELAGEKLQNSNFLKLMQSISTREVELQGDKLVETGTSSAPQGEVPLQKQDLLPQVTRESELMRPHLPDPLAHIKDGDLSGINDPLLAAKIISGNQVQTSDWMEDDSWLDMTEPRTSAPPKRKNNIMSDAWQEVYDDYKNDDDSH